MLECLLYIKLCSRHYLPVQIFPFETISNKFPTKLFHTSCCFSKQGSLCLFQCTCHFVVTLTFLSFSSVAQSCPTVCEPLNCSTPGLPVHHQLPEFTQTRIHRVSDAIQPSHPRSSPSPPAPNPSQHQSLLQ